MADAISKLNNRSGTKRTCDRSGITVPGTFLRRAIHREIRRKSQTAVSIRQFGNGRGIEPASPQTPILRDKIVDPQRVVSLGCFIGFLRPVIKIIVADRRIIWQRIQGKNFQAKRIDSILRNFSYNAAVLVTTVFESVYVLWRSICWRFLTKQPSGGRISYPFKKIPAVITRL